MPRSRQQSRIMMIQPFATMITGVSGARARRRPRPCREASEATMPGILRFGRMAWTRHEGLIQFTKLHRSINMASFFRSARVRLISIRNHFIFTAYMGPWANLAEFLLPHPVMDYRPLNRGDSCGGDEIWRAEIAYWMRGRRHGRPRRRRLARPIAPLNLGLIRRWCRLTPFGVEGLFTERLINPKAMPRRLAPHPGR